MTELPASIKDSTRSLRALLLGYWLGSSALLTIVFGAVDLVERHREVLHDAAHMRDLVAAALFPPIRSADRQMLLEAYANSPREDKLDGMNFVLVVNDLGKIVYSSRPAWLGLPITDPLLARVETDDPDFDAVVHCFLRNPGQCMDLSSTDLQLRTGSFTVVSSVRRPGRDLGLEREELLVVINYDPGVVLADYGQDIAITLLFSLIVSGLLTLVLWYLLRTKLLPQLAEAAHTDTLTQLINRGMFMEQAKDLLAEAEDRDGDMVFAILDIDHFKRVNDTYGHGCGDAALAHVAEIFRMVIRPDDLVCRFGGEEFALLFNGSRESVGRALDRLRLQLEMTRLNFAGHQLKLSASIGAVATADCGYNIDYLYNMADKALYVAKQSGRNRLEWNDGLILSRLGR